LVKFLALPHGVKLQWDADGALTVDRSRVADDDDDSLDDSLS
jgi:hypothetical protein